MSLETVLTTDARDAASRPNRPASAWARFADANRRICRTRFQTRLYPVTHMKAFDCWLERRVRHSSGGHLLEFGCGRTFRLTRVLGAQFDNRSATDIEEVDAAAVPAGVTFRRCTTRDLPFASEQFDVVVIRSVIEHLDDPMGTFRELARVVKPGGYVLMNLPNKWDYASVVARLAGRFKSSILKSVVRMRFDDFPVLYRCNTRSALRANVEPVGWQIEEFQPLPSQPSYLAFFVPLYLLGAVYQFCVSLLCLDVLQPSFIVALRKREVRD